MNPGSGIVAGLIICMIAGGGCIFAFTNPAAPDTGSPAVPPEYNRSIILETELPPSPVIVPFCHVISVQKFSAGTGTVLEVKKSIPSTGEAPGIAEKILEGYGGLPADAVLEKTEHVYMKKYNLATSTIEEQYPQYTRVNYRQYVNGTLIMGSDLSVSLGEGGELLDLSKHWGILEFTGEVPIISAEKGLEKLRSRDLLKPLQCSLDGYHITRIEFAYYIDTHLPDVYPQMVPPDECTPVWIFYGVKPGTGADPFPILVNATGD